jgi:hypothetical protein
MGFWIEDGVRRAVAGEKALQANHARLREFADHDRADQIDLDKADAPRPRETPLGSDASAQCD